MAVLYSILLIASFLFLFVWLPIRAFRIHPLWSIAIIIIPLANLVFGVFHWKEAKQPLLMGIGSLVTVMGLFIASSVSTVFF